MLSLSFNQHLKTESAKKFEFEESVFRLLSQRKSNTPDINHYILLFDFLFEGYQKSPKEVECLTHFSPLSHFYTL